MGNSTAQRCALVVGLAASLLGCASETPGAGRILTAEERSVARSVEPFGDAAMTVGGRNYVGSAIVGVNATTERITLLLTGRTVTPPTLGAGGVIAIPVAIARELSLHGWDFTVQLNTDLVFADPEIATFNASGFAGFTPTELRMRAEADGLFVATLTLGHADGRVETVEVHGRLLGGCEIGGGPSGIIEVADPSTVPLCDAVIGSL